MLEECESPIAVEIIRAIGCSALIPRPIPQLQADLPTKKKLAKESGWFNLQKCPIFMELFPGKRQKSCIHNFLFRMYIFRTCLRNH